MHVGNFHCLDRFYARVIRFDRLFWQFGKFEFRIVRNCRFLLIKMMLLVLVVKQGSPKPDGRNRPIWAGAESSWISIIYVQKNFFGFARLSAYYHLTIMLILVNNVHYSPNNSLFLHKGRDDQEVYPIKIRSFEMVKVSKHVKLIFFNLLQFSIYSRNSRLRRHFPWPPGELRLRRLFC